MKRAIVSLLLCFALVVGMSLAQGPGGQGAVTAIRSRFTIPNAAGLVGIFLNNNDGFLYKCINGTCGRAGMQLVTSGSQALSTSQINSAACVVTTVSNANILSTDFAAINLSGDPTGTTGYIPSTSGTLYSYYWISAGALNVKVCNNTSAAITPGAVTINFGVWR